MEFIYLIAFVIFLGALLIFKFILEYIVKQSVQNQPLPYRAKLYLFSRSEHEFLRILNESIDRQRFLVFPKVRLADFIEVTAKGKDYQGCFNKIKSKHVDFLVWDVQNNEVALAIELDGKSHNSEKMQKRDGFVNKLYERVEIKLIRISVGSDFIEEIQKLKIVLSS